MAYNIKKQLAAGKESGMNGFGDITTGDISVGLDNLFGGDRSNKTWLTFNSTTFNGNTTDFVAVAVVLVVGIIIVFLLKPNTTINEK